jgi:acyl-CoA reductase-like NAD-dependent aldehyde dehydrogenase
MPLAALRMVDVLNEVLLAGALNALTGDDTDFNIGAEMSSHPHIAKIVFTGSASTGRHIMCSAADTLKRLTLEPRGNDVGVVLPDAYPRRSPKGFTGAPFSTMNA